jgi:hypothetical protein
MAIHKGTELNNVNETWNENERRRQQGEDSPMSGARGDAGAVPDELQKVIQEEAAEYDNTNKEAQLLSGDRATLNDDQGGGADE